MSMPPWYNYVKRRDTMDKINQIEGGFFGMIVGDALGVPVEFKSREELKENPV